jgi:hypothetical protein
VTRNPPAAARKEGGWRAPVAVEEALALLRYIHLVNDQVPPHRVAQQLGRLLGTRAKEAYVTYGEQLIHQGKKEGRHERGHELLCKLLERRFGPLPASCLARLEAATEEDIDRWAERILDAKTLDEVFEA